EAINNMTKSPLQIIRDRGEDPETVINELLEFEEMVIRIRKMRGKGQEKPQQDSEEDNAEGENPEAG
ncbi:hypothetical protein P7M54_25270, partial [Vibrio parahaemolyticus]|nr:hypothetical protein [Vibrio parahaemolyticus]